MPPKPLTAATDSKRSYVQDSQSPTVIFVVLASGLGGSVRSLATVLHRLPELRRLVVCPPDSAIARLVDAGHLAEGLVHLPRDGRRRVLHRIGAVAQVFRLARRERVRLCAIHANGLSELGVVLLPALVARRRIVVWVHEWAVPGWSRILAPLLRSASRWIHFAAVSQTSREMVLGAGLARDDNVTVVANPIDPDDVKALGRRAAGEPLNVAFLGAPATYKGFHLLPELVRLTGDLGLHWTVYSGPESSMPGTFAALRDLGITVTGKVPDVRTVYGSCDMVVIPSERESFGRVAAEAMINGVPVIATDLPAMREVVGDEVAGLLVRSGDVKGFAEAIRRLATDPQLRRELGEAGHQRSARFGPEPVVATLRGLYGLP